MKINFIAGRTYHDVNMWYVFPWVIEMNDPSQFRDLSVPIGAINKDRFESFTSRLCSLCDDDSMGRFLYGAHYSGSGILIKINL